MNIYEFRLKLILLVYFCYYDKTPKPLIAKNNTNSLLFYLLDVSYSLDVE